MPKVPVKEEPGNQEERQQGCEGTDEPPAEQGETAASRPLTRHKGAERVFLSPNPPFLQVLASYGLSYGLVRKPVAALHNAAAEPLRHASN